MQRWDQAVAILHAVGRGAVTRIVHEFRTAYRRAEHAPYLLPGDCQREIARLGVEGLIGHDDRIRGAHRFRHFTIREVIRDRGAEQ